MSETKLCPCCETAKPLDQFHKKLDGYQSHCKACRNAKSKARKSKPIPVTPPAPKAEANGHLSLLDAAAKVLASLGSPANVKALADAVIAKGLWKGESKLPSQTLSAQIQREINTKGKESRFARAGRGLFVAPGWRQSIAEASR